MSDTTSHHRAFQTPRDFRSKLRMWFDQDHICVLTIGKTASSAIIQGLIDAGVPAYQAHTLSRAPQEYLFVSGLGGRPVQNAGFQIKTLSWLWLMRQREKRFITTFRDPFARNMSAFFEQSWKLGLKVEDMGTDELVALYDRYGPHDVTRTWFHDNLTRPFGLSVDALDLVSQPVQELAAHKHRFLFMKYEDQSLWEQALSRFAGVDVVLKRRNDSTRKSYYDAMARLQAAWRPSPRIVERSLDRALWATIYSQEDKAAIRSRWNIPEALAP